MFSWLWMNLLKFNSNEEETTRNSFIHYLFSQTFCCCFCVHKISHLLSRNVLSLIINSDQMFSWLAFKRLNWLTISHLIKCGTATPLYKSIIILRLSLYQSFSPRTMLFAKNNVICQELSPCSKYLGEHGNRLKGSCQENEQWSTNEIFLLYQSVESHDGGCFLSNFYTSIPLSIWLYYNQNTMHFENGH